MKGKLIGYAVDVTVQDSSFPCRTPKAELLGYEGHLVCRTNEGKLHIEVPYLTVDEMPCRVAYVFKLTGLATAGM